LKKKEGLDIKGFLLRKINSKKIKCFFILVKILFKFKYLNYYLENPLDLIKLILSVKIKKKNVHVVSNNISSSWIARTGSKRRNTENVRRIFFL